MADHQDIDALRAERAVRASGPLSDHTRLRLSYAVRRTLLGLACFLPLVLCAAASSAAQPGQGASSHALRDEAIRAIPFSRMNEQTQAKIWSVVSKPSLYRRLPAQAVRCDPDLYVFLIRHPEILVGIWQLMDITKVQIKRTGPYTFNASDGAGTVSSSELVYATPDVHVYYSQGIYEGPLLRSRINGNCVLLLRSVFSRQGDQVHVTSYLDVFVRVDHAGIDILAKTLHPLVGKAADYNFTETVKFVGQVHQASQTNGPGMERLAAKLANVDPAIRQTFTQHTDVVYQRAVLRGSPQLTPLVPANPPLGQPSGIAPAYPPNYGNASAMLEPILPRRQAPLFRR